MSLLEITIQKLLNDKQKGLKVQFKTNGSSYFVYVANSLYITMNESKFNKFYKQWKMVNQLLKGGN